MTPTRMYQLGVRSTWTTGACSIVMLAGWLSGAMPDARSSVMLYVTAVVATAASAAVAAVAHVHLAIHEAFRAGYKTGQAGVECPEGIQVPQQRRGLRAVD